MAYQLCTQFPSTLGLQAPTPRCIVRCKVAGRARLVCTAFIKNGNGLPDHNGNVGLPLSMFTPYKHLPPEGEMLAAADAICDPNVERCKTPIYTYETKCSCCCGTGFVKSRANGHHASLSTCLLCHGLGYVRRTTARFAPDNGPTSGVFTLARPEPDPKHKAGKGKAKPKH